MKNSIQSGDTITHTALADIVSGQPIVVGDMVGIAAKSVLSGEEVTLNLRGVFSVTKVGTQAWAKGDKIFWDKTNLRFTKTASADADLLAGVAFEAAGAGAGVTTGYILLLPSIGKKAAATADFAGADLAAVKVELNAFLATLRAVGIIDTA
jgi:predicted RecA/RadA family phage recombinase